MPLPRFHRLDSSRRRQILDVARAHIAREGAEGASYNKIIAEAGISKTSAYLYFDGKEDLVGEVRRDAHERLLAVAGVWTPARSKLGFWRNLATASSALHAHLCRNLEDLMLLAQVAALGPEGPFDPWLNAVLENGKRLGIVRRDVDGALLFAMSRAAIGAADEHVIKALIAGRNANMDEVWKLLRGLWAPSSGVRRARR